MEARALHDFSATQVDELSFQRGSILKVSALHAQWLAQATIEKAERKSVKTVFQSIRLYTPF